MIHGEDEIEETPIDFSWFYFIGKTKLCMTFKETGRLTLSLFNKFYEHYKTNWSLEMRLAKANMTYEDAFKRTQQQEEWF